MNKKICVSLIAIVFSFAAGPASANAPALGDLNGDGVIDVLDVQAAIAQVLQLIPESPLGDLDENGVVDILDVQNLINTALGTGGLVQRLTGRIEVLAELLEQGLQVVAISQDGEVIIVEVDLATGSFSFTLPVKNQWWLAFIVDSGGDIPEVLPIHFPIADDFSTLLPLLELSQCDILDLGTLAVGDVAVVVEDLRTLLGTINVGQYLIDADGNGIPDFLDRLLAYLDDIPDLAAYLEPLVPGLIDTITPCIQENLPDLTTVSLVDENGNGIPDFIEPLLQCLEDNVIPWLQESGIPLLPGMGAVIAESIVAYLEGEVPNWMDDLVDPALIDANGNGIPDILEPYLANIPLPPWVDADGNGIPDFLE